MDYPPPPPPPPPRRVGGEPFLPDLSGFGLQVTKPVAVVGKVIMRGLGFGDQVAELVPQEVGMIVTDAPGRPKAKTPGSLKCTYCGCVHRLADLKTTANCPNCAGNKMVAAETTEPFDLKAHLDRRRDYMQAVAQAVGPTLRRRRDYVGTESGGPQ